MSDTRTRSVPTLPLWAAGLDALALACLALTLSAAMFGGVRFTLLDVRISATSVPRLALLLAALAAIRHGFAPRPPLHRRVMGWIRTVVGSPAARAVWPVFVLSRAGVLAVGLLSVLLMGYTAEGVPFRVSENEAFNLSARWDAGWYLDIAQEGYLVRSQVADQQNIAFFPAYPVAMRVVGALLGSGTASPYMYGKTMVDPRPLRVLLGGLLISLAAFFGALVYVYRLATEDFDDRVGWGSTLLLASYPFAIFFSAPYTESLFLLGGVGAFYHLRRAESVAAGAWGLLAGLTKANGFLFCLPLFLLVTGWGAPATTSQAGRPRTWTDWIREPGRVAAAAMPVVGMMLFSGYLYALTGRPLAWLDVHREAWGRSFGGIDQLLIDRYETIAGGGLYAYVARQPIEFLYALVILGVLAFVWPVARRLGPAYAALLVVIVIPPLLAGGFVSIGRFSSVLFPMFIYLAWALPLRWVVALAIVFAQLQTLAAAMFYTWRPIY